MYSITPLPIQLDGRLHTPTAHFRYTEPRFQLGGSKLLKAIRSALQSSRGSPDTVNTAITPSCHTGAEEEELTWDANTVTLSAGGILLKRWDLRTEGQPVQCACIGWFEQSSTVFASSAARSGSYADEEEVLDGILPDPNERPTFGPFSRQTRDSKPQNDPGSRSRAVFIFLRSIGKVYVLNGLEYTFHLPFIVRNAWALSPHGIMLQRFLDSNELEEAKSSGDEPLPTLFTMINPFSEAAMVGLGYAIKGGLPVALEDVEPEKTSSSIPAQEEVLWVSSRSSEPTDQLFVTLDKTAQTVTLWRYIFVHSKSASSSIIHGSTSRLPAKHRRSMSSPLSPRRTSLHHTNISFELPAEPPLASLPGKPPSLTAAVPMASIVPGAVPDVSWASHPANVKSSRPSLGSVARADLPFNIDKAGFSSTKETSSFIDPIENARMRPAYCVDKLYSTTLSKKDCDSWWDITFGIYDRRWDGEKERTQFALCLPWTSKATIIPLTKTKEKRVVAEAPVQVIAVSVAAMKILRPGIDDLLLVKPDGTLAVLSYGYHEFPLDAQMTGAISGLKAGVESSVALSRRHVLESTRVTINLLPIIPHVQQVLLTLAMVLPLTEFSVLHHRFLSRWSTRRYAQDEETLDDICGAIVGFLGLDMAERAPPTSSNPWDTLCNSPTAKRFANDIALRKLNFPRPQMAEDPPIHHKSVHKHHSSVLVGLHHLGQCFLLSTDRHKALMKLVPTICQLAYVVRPEWADYWKRLFPDVSGAWRSPQKTVPTNVDEQLPIWPTDVFSNLFGRINNSDWNKPTVDSWHLILPKGTPPSFAFGRQDPLVRYHQVTAIYDALADSKESTRKRAEVALRLLIRTGDGGYDLLNRLPIGLAMPLHEGIRTCQVSPAGEWNTAAYQFIGRDDLAENGASTSEALFTSGYRTVKDYVLPTFSRKSMNEHFEEARKAVIGELAAVTGMELGMEDYITTRFSQDKRLEEIGRILCSSHVPVIKVVERTALNELDQAKEYQHYALRIAERTLALPPGRALHTFGCVEVVTKEAYSIPKIEYSVRIQPQNQLITPEPGKIPLECSSWGEFHNGVAAGLRISPSATGVQSSWIKFNKPSELTPQHAGFLYALGLAGHLREMLTWHTFAYLTPKHDHTSIAILLGLSAANVGTSNRHVTKLIAVHTPALLPTPGVDLNIPLITQAAGLSGLGLLYMGTRNRRMAEVCLSQISRRDLVQPDLSNEYREAYTYSTALAFGMIMLGKGSDVPADLAILSRLRVLIHGESHTLDPSKNIKPTFDLSLTSPAASMALGLMYLRTNRRDIADILTIPDTIVALDRIQPNFLMIRAIARALIMWDDIAPTEDWLNAQIPHVIKKAVDGGKQKLSVPESFDLAYWNIIAGCCFALALKYAGSARQEASYFVLRYYDIFSRMAYTNTAAFEHRIKRAAVRDGLNLISISLSMIIAGSGDIHVLRRLRYAFGMHNPPLRYGTHVAIHMSIGLLFLGGGRYTLGTSDAAIAAMVVAFFPRFNQVSSDNKSYLQALRHLWVLAVEPRCLIARDVDTKEVVFLPVKIKLKDGNESGTTQLVMPTLVPDIDKIQSLRVDTPRYWPFYINIVNLPFHKEALLKNQTLFVKRRTAFLSYMEDPKGSRSLFVRSGSSAGDAAVLDFPQLKNADTHPATDLHRFISSYSNDPFFLAFADHFCREESDTDDEKLFFAYCYATLHDSILQDKPRTIQIHLTLYRHRRMSIYSPEMVLAHQDLKFSHEFYTKIFDRRFSGRAENNPRPSLLRESTLRSGLYELEGKLESVHEQATFGSMLRRYARGSEIPLFELGTESSDMSRALAWYLQRNSIPTSSVLLILSTLADNSRSRCLQQPPPQGTTASGILEEGIKEVVQKAGSQLTSSVGTGWSLRCVDEIMDAWEHGKANAEAAAQAAVQMTGIEATG
ncbi:hypothetical protein BDY19DRAFT_1058080 [Irpex rosettiformis]|uniref:Uncharacterized protein n=1 Tax=Irpex rosettiformis TaxID=378272 RepID=A0ACB8U003_9APHY|nr:hypothetical protein BDY19DRAFT_1058080 [Irpex rosettiformis]